MDPRRYPEGSYKIRSIRPSLRPFVLPPDGRFLGTVSIVSSKFWHGARKPYKVVREIAGFSEKNCLPQKLGKWTKTGTKTGFFEFAEIFGH